MSTQLAMLHIKFYIFLRELIHTLVVHDEGQDMVEYALLAGVVSIASVAVAVLIGPYLQDMYGDVLNAWKSI